MDIAGSEASRPMPATADAQPKAITRLLFVDNLRVYLTILVVLHHLMITYAGTGSWYYIEGQPDLVNRVKVGDHIQFVRKPGASAPG